MDSQMDVLVNVLALLNWFAALSFYAVFSMSMRCHSLSSKPSIKAASSCYPSETVASSQEVHAIGCEARHVLGEISFDQIFLPLAPMLPQAPNARRPPEAGATRAMTRSSHEG